MTEFVSKIHEVTQYLTHDFLGGPKFVKLNWIIDFQKGATVFWVLYLMYAYQNFTAQAMVYLALHGSYGFCWIIKDLSFPDPSWQQKVTVGGAAAAVVAVLGPYWLIPFVLISPVLGDAHVGAGWVWMTIAISIHTLGIAIMMAADGQKYFTLKFRKGLITSGLFRYIRHPNYLGEMMIYGAYAIMAWHWVPWLILGLIWIVLFAINILMKERSLSRYPEWQEYKSRTWYLVPGLL